MSMPNLDLLFIRIRKLVALAMDPIYFCAFLRHGVAPAIEHKSLLQNLPLDFVVDVGANRGQFSLVCRRLNPKATIVAFEPQTEPASIYRAIFVNDSRVRLHTCALGIQRGEITMNVSGSDDSSSLLPISKVQTENFPGTGTVATSIVAIGPLPDFLRSSEMGEHNLLKIDVQGFELEVLKSAESLLSQFNWIYAECSFKPLYEGQALAPEIEAYLLARNFRKVSVSNISRERKGRAPLQGDFLFENTAPRTG